MLLTFIVVILGIISIVVAINCDEDSGARSGLTALLWPIVLCIVISLAWPWVPDWEELSRPGGHR